MKTSDVNFEKFLSLASATIERMRNENNRDVCVLLGLFSAIGKHMGENLENELEQRKRLYPLGHELYVQGLEKKIADFVERLDDANFRKQK